MLDWDKVRKEYESTDISINDLADKYDIKRPTIKSRKQRQYWAKNASRKDASKMQKNASKPKVKKVVIPHVKPAEVMTEKQRLFCLYYDRNSNATMAYLKAYQCSYDVANAEGYKHLVKPCIRAEIERLKEIKRQSIMLTEDDIAERYMRIALADISDYLKFGSREVLRHDKDGNEYVEFVNYIDLKESDAVDGGLISEVKQGPNGVSIKLESRDKALQWLSDYFDMHPMSKHKQWYDKEKLKIDREGLELRREGENKKW